MLKLLCPLLVVNLRISRLIWRRTAYFVQNNTTIILPGDTRRTRRPSASCHAERRTPIFGAKLEAWRHKMFDIFYFSQCDMVFGIVNLFFWIFKAVSSEKSYLILMPFLLTYIDVRTVKFFPPVEFWLINSNFRRASRMQGLAIRTQLLSTRNPLAFGYKHWPKVDKDCLSIFNFFFQESNQKRKEKKYLHSHAGNRTRAAAVRAPNPNH